MTVRTWMVQSASAAMLLAGMMLTGCEAERGHTLEAEFAATRPEPLVTAAGEIRSGQGAAAQVRLEEYLSGTTKGSDPYRPEALYLLGQSLSAQGDYKGAKKKLDQASDETDDRNLKALTVLGRADANYALGDYNGAARQYQWLEVLNRKSPAIPQDEVLFKLGMATKKGGYREGGDYWFKQVIELYATGPYFEKARAEHSEFTPTREGVAPRVYTLEVASYNSRAKADERASMLREKGYRDVQVIDTTRSGFAHYEVHVGKFVNRNDAMAAKTDAEIAGMTAGIRPRSMEPTPLP